MLHCPYFYFIFQMRKKIQLISNFLYKKTSFPLCNRTCSLSQLDEKNHIILFLNHLVSCLYSLSSNFLALDIGQLSNVQEMIMRKHM